MAAVVFGEPEAEVMLAAMRRSAGDLAIGAATLVEAGIVVEAKQGPAASSDLRTLLSTLEVRVLDVDEGQAATAVAAWRRFGKGRHPARLNFGDCLSYAAAKATGAALLYTGDDFPQADIPSGLV